MSVTGFNRRRREMEALKIERQSKTRPAEGQEIKEKSFHELRKEAKEEQIEGYGKMTKNELIEALKERLYDNNA